MRAGKRYPVRQRVHSEIEITVSGTHLWKSMLNVKTALVQILVEVMHTKGHSCCSVAECPETENTQPLADLLSLHFLQIIC